MKKLLLALPILTLPLTAMAQDKPATMPQSLIDAAKKRFKPIFCGDDMGMKAKALNQCYLKIAFDPTDPEYQECILADMFLIGRIDAERTVLQKKGQPDPYPNLPSFLTRDSRKERVKRFFNILENKGYTPQEKVNYLLKPSKEFGKYIDQSCNK